MKSSEETEGVQGNFEPGLPNVAIVVPFHNYGKFVGRALRSISAQDHSRIECIVVDDASDPDEARVLERELEKLDDARMSLLTLEKNVGQIHAIYRGLEETAADFICVLDPDDYYKPAFVSRMLRAHLNPQILAAIACCDQAIVRPDGEMLTSARFGKTFGKQAGEVTEIGEKAEAPIGFSGFYPPNVTHWVWSSLSSMMFRRDAMELVWPRKPLSYRGQGDDYLAQTAHMMGGTLFVEEALVCRCLHGNNESGTGLPISPYQRTVSPEIEALSRQAKFDAIEAFIINGGTDCFDHGYLWDMLITHFKPEEVTALAEKQPLLAELIKAGGKAP